MGEEERYGLWSDLGGGRRGRGRGWRIISEEVGRKGAGKGEERGKAKKGKYLGREEVSERQ